MTLPPLMSAQQALWGLARQSLRAYLKNVVIDSRPDPRPFGEVAEPWQWEKILDPLIPAVESIARLRTEPPKYDGYWFVLTKGSDKTSAIARICSWVLQFSHHYTSISVGAADLDQAALLRDAMESEKRLNPWFHQDYKINRYDASGPTGALDILTSDAASGQGKRSLIYIADEITVWRSQDMWDLFAGSASKYRDCLLIVLSNAGWLHTWQAELFEQVKSDPRWFVYEAPGIMASWIDRAKVASLRKKMLATEAMRVFDNIWVQNLQNAVFPAELVEQVWRTHRYRALDLPDTVGA
mgnify:FL=1